MQKGAGHETTSGYDWAATVLHSSAFIGVGNLPICYPHACFHLRSAADFKKSDVNNTVSTLLC